ALKQLLPDADVRVEGVGDGVVLAGSVSSPVESQKAYDVAVRVVGDGSKGVNSLIVKGRDQVLIKVKVAEVQRGVIKQLGINLQGSVNTNNGIATFVTQNPFSAFGSPLGSNSATLSTNSTSATLSAMERAGVVRTLAEPNLTAISGESASFIAGGEF